MIKKIILNNLLNHFIISYRAALGFEGLLNISGYSLQYFDQGLKDILSALFGVLKVPGLFHFYNFE